MIKDFSRRWTIKLRKVKIMGCIMVRVVWRTNASLTVNSKRFSNLNQYLRQFVAKLENRIVENKKLENLAKNLPIIKMTSGKGRTYFLIISDVFKDIYKANKININR